MRESAVVSKTADPAIPEAVTHAASASASPAAASPAAAHSAAAHSAPVLNSSAEVVGAVKGGFVQRNGGREIAVIEGLEVEPVQGFSVGSKHPLGQWAVEMNDPVGNRKSGGRREAPAVLFDFLPARELSGGSSDGGLSDGFG